MDTSGGHTQAAPEQYAAAASAAATVATSASGEAEQKTPVRRDTVLTDPDEVSSDSFDDEHALEGAKEAAELADVELPTDSVFVNGVKGDVGDAEEEEEDEDEESADGAPKPRKPWYRHAWKRWRKFYAANSFLVLVLVVILLAYAYPPLGAIYLAPHITATWIAVMFIFTMAGLGLKTDEFSKAFQRLYFNTFIHVFNFGVVSACVFGFSRFLASVGALTQSLADGMTICACLPLTVNMIMVLTKSSGGDEAAAVFNAAFGNMLGVFLSPALILVYLGVKGEIDMITVFFKLAIRVVLPVFIGQVLQKFSKTVVAFVKKFKKYFKTLQEYCLVYIVYTVFCKTFLNGSDSNAVDIFLMIFLQGCLLCAFMVLAWFVLRLLFRDQPKLRVMGLYGCTHKTVAMGVPLINAIYETNPLVGLYTLPLLIWHPTQLVIGSALAPRLAAWVEQEERRLGTHGGVDEDEQQQGGMSEGGIEVESVAAGSAAAGCTRGEEP